MRQVPPRQVLARSMWVGQVPPRQVLGPLHVGPPRATGLRRRGRRRRGRHARAPVHDRILELVDDRELLLDIHRFDVGHARRPSP